MKPLPSLLAAAPLLVTLMLVAGPARAQDGRGARVEARASWSHAPIPTVPSRLVVQAWSPERTPVNAAVTVRLEELILGVGQTGANGLLGLDVTLPPSPYHEPGVPEVDDPLTVEIEPIDLALAPHRLMVDASPARGPGIVLRRAGLTAGERVEGEVRTVGPSDHVDLGVVVGDAVVHVAATDAVHHRATFAFPLPGDAAGIGTVTALVGSESAAARFVVLEAAPVGRVQDTAAASSVRVGPEEPGPWHIHLSHLGVDPETGVPPASSFMDMEVQENIALWLAGRDERHTIVWHPPLALPPPTPATAPPAITESVATALQALPGPDPDRDLDGLLLSMLLGMAALLIGLAFVRRATDHGWGHRLGVVACALAVALTPLLAKVGAGARPTSVPSDLLTLDAPGLAHLAEPRRYPGLPADSPGTEDLLEANDALAPDTATLITIDRDGVWLDGVRVVPLTAGQAEGAQARQGFLLPPLHEALSARRDELRRTSSATGIEAPAAVTLSVASDVPTHTLIQVAFTAAQAGLDRMRLVRHARWTAVAPPVFGPASSPWWFVAALALILGALAASKARWPSWVAVVGVAAFAGLVAVERTWPTMTTPLAPFPLELAATRAAPWVLVLIGLAALYEAVVGRRAPSAGLAALAVVAAVLMVPLTRDYRLYATPASEAVLYLPTWATPAPPPVPNRVPEQGHAEVKGRPGEPLRLLVLAESRDGRVVAGSAVLEGAEHIRVQPMRDDGSRFEVGFERREVPSLLQLLEPTGGPEGGVSVAWVVPWYRRRPLSPPRPIRLLRDLAPPPGERSALEKLLAPANEQPESKPTGGSLLDSLPPDLLEPPSEGGIPIQPPAP